MIGFCGALDFEKNRVDFATLKKMCGIHGAGCAFINREFGILCSSDGSFEDNSLQPVTLRYNGSLYTAATVVPQSMRYEQGNTAQAVLEGYLEVGEEFIQRLDFPYALALYDGRRAELLIAKGHEGDMPLFYTVRDGTLYFASSLRPLIRLYGGCVRISGKALLSHVMGDCTPFPEGLFADISSVKRGQGLFCSRLTRDTVPTPCGVYPFCDREKLSGYMPEYVKKNDMKRILTDALFAFNYPQFDCLMPSLLPYISQMKEVGAKEICVEDPLKDTYPEYSEERSRRLGEILNVDIRTVSAERQTQGARELRSIDRALDGLLDEYISSKRFPSHVLGNGVIETVKECRSLPLRIRGKGMLIQTAMWFDVFNLIVV